MTKISIKYAENKKCIKSSLFIELLLLLMLGWVKVIKIVNCDKVCCKRTVFTSNAKEAAEKV